MSEFEKWYKEKYPQALKQNTTDSDKYALEIWQAATAESDKRITELNAENKQIDAINASLQAHINVLREAFEEIDMQLENGFVRCQTCGDQEDTKDLDCRIWIADALASTPAQSLAQHDNEVIEKCAKVCDSWSLIGKSIAHDVRTLKG